MARSPLTETYKRVEGMVSYVQQNLSGDEYNLFLDMVAPQPEPEPAAKKTRKKRTTKSAKAQSLESVISKTPKVDADADEAAARTQEIIGNFALCTARVPTLDVPCGEREDALIHDPNGGYASYHPFVPPAQTATRRSRQKEKTGRSEVHSETQKASAMGAGAD